jgi:hypothetical protein
VSLTRLVIGIGISLTPVVKSNGGCISTCRTVNVFSNGDVENQYEISQLIVGKHGGDLESDEG